MSKLLSVTKKELWSYFSSPTALVFLATYLVVNLFTFFWVEKFFSRNIADMRPLFEWMPILLIFLIATLTMKMWSEERRMGTVEFLLTLPIKTYELVVGKFLACMALVAIALFLTLGLALSVGVLGNLDWGPVIGAYLASLLLAGAYTSIGLYVSAKTESQIISLIITAVICFLFYTIGSEMLVGFVGNKAGEVLKLLGTGSRFESISRGVLDLRDIYYYISITLVFLAANTFALDRLKWSAGEKPNHKTMVFVMTLLVTNLLTANVWLNQISALRLDMTKDKMYSISPTTKELLTQLEEPLLIRGYFSERTHPLLAPLVPAIRDLLVEYKIVGKGKVQFEFVDPRENQDIEAEANRRYNIEPMPFQILGRHSAEMVNSYFNIVIQYGDQHKVLGFNDLIAVKHDGLKNIDVQLKNLEYDINKSIQFIVKGFKKSGNVFASFDKPVRFVGYVSEDTIPEKLKTLTDEIKTALKDYETKSDGKFTSEFLNPQANETVAQEIQTKYGFGPQSMGLFSQESFYFYLTLQYGDKVIPLGIPEELKVDGFKTALDASLKKLTPGFMKTVGIYTPPSAQMNPMMAQFGQQPQGKQFRAIEQKLEENFTTSSTNLDSGVVPDEVDALLVLAPKDLTEKQLFAIDQFLMKGGTVIMSTASVGIERQQRGFDSTEYNSGLNEWLEHNGIQIPKELVLDMQNSGFPSMRKRMVQGITIKEPYLAPYPFFSDVRNTGLNQKNGITSTLDQVTMTWSSPIVVNNDKNKERKVTPLVNSSKKSWRSTDIAIEPNPETYPETGFAVGEKQEPQTLAVMVEGRFESFFKGKTSPLLKKEEAKEGEKHEEKEDHKKQDTMVSGVIDKSPEIARLIIFASNEFIADDTIQLNSMLSGSQYTNSLQIVENAVSWSTEDRSLLALRNRGGHFARTLVPLAESDKRFWEGLNYALALVGLLVVYGGYRRLHRKQVVRFKKTNVA